MGFQRYLFTAILSRDTVKLVSEKLYPVLLLERGKSERGKDVQGFLPVPVSPDNQSLLNLVFQFFLEDQGHRATRNLSMMEMRRNGP